MQYILKLVNIGIHLWRSKGNYYSRKIILDACLWRLLSIVLGKGVGASLGKCVISKGKETMGQLPGANVLSLVFLFKVSTVLTGFTTAKTIQIFIHVNILWSLFNNALIVFGHLVNNYSSNFFLKMHPPKCITIGIVSLYIHATWCRL